MDKSEIFTQIPELTFGSVPFFLWAILIGIFLSLVVNMGPAFITLVQTSLHRGARSAAWFAVGVIFNDAMIIALCILTSVQVVIGSQMEVNLFSIGAGIVLVLFGIFTFRKKVPSEEDVMNQQKKAEEIIKVKDTKPSWYVFFGKGFALNLLNPFVWIFWFSAVAVVAGIVKSDVVNPKMCTILFFAIILGSTFALELLKAWGAAKLKVFFNPKRTTIMNRVAGVLLVVCGIYFIVLQGVVNLL